MSELWQSVICLCKRMNALKWEWQFRQASSCS